MKKIILIFFIFLFYSLNSFSQRFDGGTTLGFDVSQINGDHSGGYNKIGLDGGFWIKTDFSDKSGGQFEIKYNDKGSKEVNKITKLFVFKIELKYFEFPLIYNHFWNDKLTLQLGIIPEYLFNGAITDEFDITTDATDNFNSFGLEALAGVQYNFSNNLGVNVRLAYSLIPIMSHPGNQTYFLDRGQYNDLICFNLYYQFNK